MATIRITVPQEVKDKADAAFARNGTTTAAALEMMVTQVATTGTTPLDGAFVAECRAGLDEDVLRALVRDTAQELGLIPDDSVPYEGFPREVLGSLGLTEDDVTASAAPKMGDTMSGSVGDGVVTTGAAQQEGSYGLFAYCRLEDDTVVTHSEERPDGTVRVLVERPRDWGFDSAECELPSLRWTLVDGFCGDDLERLQRFVRNNALLIVRLAREKTPARVADHVVERMATYLECKPGDLCRTVSGNALLQALRDEKRARISGGIYHEFQVRMTYNSNHIEGNRLTEDQTRMIFETRTIDAEGAVPVDDVIETVNHFRAMDLCIDRAEEPLTGDLVKELHRVLKQGTRDASLGWFAVGDYKQRPNVVGGRATCAPADVAREMGRLVSDYEARDSVSFEDIVRFHHDFERIHPFQDGNGRVGRLVAFKECLRHGHIPFLIEDSKKSFYYRGLAQWESEPGYLIDTCLDGQDTVAALMDALGIDR